MKPPISLRYACIYAYIYIIKHGWSFLIIKKVNIIAFGRLKNKIIEFDDGINVVYGENEAGKSTIQAFIKVWLYGFNNNSTYPVVLLGGLIKLIHVKH